MKRLICHPYMLFLHFKNTSLPTNVYLNDFCSIAVSSRLTEQQEMAGTAAKRQDMRTKQVPHFTGFHTNFWCIWFALVSKFFLCTETMCRHTAKVPLPPMSTSQTYNILSPPSLPLHWFTSSFHRKRDLLWWQHSHFFTLRTIWPSLKFTEVQQIVKYPTKHFSFIIWLS